MLVRLACINMGIHSISNQKVSTLNLWISIYRSKTMTATVYIIPICVMYLWEIKDEKLVQQTALAKNYGNAKSRAV